MTGRVRLPFVPLALVAASLFLAACRQDMHDTPRYEPLEATAFFGDARSARPFIPDTVARGGLREDDHLYRGKQGRDFVTAFPFAIEAATLARGRERYDIYCSPCHARTGAGDGMVVRRGFKQPPSFHEPRLREAAVGYFFDVISNGFGVMPSYAAQIPVNDRWAIVAYVRALQRSQNAKLADVPAEHRAELDGGAPSRPTEGH